MTEIDPRLKPFADADTITWHQHTVFRPHCGDDGNLVVGDWTGLDNEDHSMPLDTWLPESIALRSETRFPIETPIASEGVGIVIVDPVTLDDVHDAVREWCRVNLGRDDVQFDN